MPDEIGNEEEMPTEGIPVGLFPLAEREEMPLVVEGEFREIPGEEEEELVGEEKEGFFEKFKGIFGPKVSREEFEAGKARLEEAKELERLEKEIEELEGLEKESAVQVRRTRLAEMKALERRAKGSGVVRFAKRAEATRKGVGSAAAALYKIGTLGGTPRVVRKELYVGRASRETYIPTSMRRLTTPPGAVAGEDSALKRASMPRLGRLQQATMLGSGAGRLGRVTLPPKSLAVRPVSRLPLPSEPLRAPKPQVHAFRRPKNSNSYRRKINRLKREIQ